MRKGDIYYADLNPVVGCEQGGVRPVLVIQNNLGNRHSPTTIVAAITSKVEKGAIPTHVNIKVDGLSRSSIVLLEQIRTIDKMRLRTYVNTVGQDVLKKIDKALVTSLGLQQFVEES